MRPPADPGHLYPGPTEFGNPKGTKGSRDEAAGSHFVVSVVGLGLVHPERNGLGGGGGAAIREPGRTRLQAAPRAAGWRSRATSAFARCRRRGAQVLCTVGRFSSRWPGKLVRLSAAPTWSFTGASHVDCRSLRLIPPSLQRNVEGTACLPRRLTFIALTTYFLYPRSGTFASIPSQV